MSTINVTLTYGLCCETLIDLPKGKTWGDANQWFVKWNTLYVFWKDGTDTEHELHDPDPAFLDMKYPSDSDIEEDEPDA